MMEMNVIKNGKLKLQRSMGKSRGGRNLSSIVSIAPVLFILTACNTQQSSNILTEEKLKKEVTVGVVTKLADMAPVKADYVCVLHPYQERIEENFPEDKVINQYLQNTKYRARESHWALVFSSQNNIDISTFKRSEDLDLLSSFNLKNPTDNKLPANFEATECAQFKHAAFIKASINNRIFVIFGRVK